MWTRGISSTGASALKVIVTVVITLSLVVIAVSVAISSFGFARTIDRSGPTVLERIQTLEEFAAAEARFVQDVDSETDTRFFPSWISGERVVALMNGTVRATVDFSELDESSLAVDESSGTIRITLPEPVLQEAEVDETTKRILARDRGLADRVQDFFATNPTDDGPLYVAAREKMNAAARETGLADIAKANTTRWLETFLTAAGFETVIITWQ